MNKAKKHRTDKRKRTRMTVRAFCACPSPYACVPVCGADEIDLYVNMDKYGEIAVSPYTSG